MMGNLIEESREVVGSSCWNYLEGTCTALEIKLAVAGPGGGDAVSGDEDGGASRDPATRPSQRKGQRGKPG